MQSVNRPLSPHLQIYRLPMLAVLSITHRATGVGLCAGALLFIYWLMALAAGPEAFASAQSVLSAWYGLVVIFGFTWALYFHLCNGIRHLMWDMGHGLELESADMSGVVVLITSSVLTILTWFTSYIIAGGGV
jgi:succinate dehydrogenase / fumarate reductase, cytochrome b subunit